jgi:hypothetical protein
MIKQPRHQSISMHYEYEHTPHKTQPENEEG